MRISVQLRGFDALSLGVKYLQVAASAGLENGVGSAALQIEQEAKTIVPVKTGALRDSIHTEHRVNEPQKQEFAVLPDTPYAARIEFGFVGTDSLGRNYHNAAQPFMRPAYDAKRDEAKKIIEDSLMEAVSNAANQTALQRLR